MSLYTALLPVCWFIELVHGDLIIVRTMDNIKQRISFQNLHVCTQVSWPWGTCLLVRHAHFRLGCRCSAASSFRRSSRLARSKNKNSVLWRSEFCGCLGRDCGMHLPAETSKLWILVCWILNAVWKPCYLSRHLPNYWTVLHRRRRDGLAIRECREKTLLHYITMDIHHDF